MPLDYVCAFGLSLWPSGLKKKFREGGDLLRGSGGKTTTFEGDHEHFMHTKFHQIPSSGSGEVENVKSLRDYDDGRRSTGGRTNDGRRAMTIAHSSLRLR